MALMTDSLSMRSIVLCLAAVLVSASALAQKSPAISSPPTTLLPGDYIAAVVNQDIVAASEVPRSTRPSWTGWLATWQPKTS